MNRSPKLSTFHHQELRHHLFERLYIFYFSLRVALIHEASLVRAAALRAVRYLLKEEKDVRILNRLGFPALVCRYVKHIKLYILYVFDFLVIMLSVNFLYF